MAKRLTNTDKWKTAFFRNLPPQYQLLWLYIHDDCDFCGIWIVDFEIAAIRIAGVTEEKASELFKDEIQILAGGDWFLPSFIEAQYGDYSEKNSIHRKVSLNLGNKGAVYKMYTSQNHTVSTVVNTVQDKDKDKDKDGIKKNKKERDFQAELPLWPTFDDFWDLYDKKIDRKLVEPEWVKLKQDAKEAIMLHIPEYKQQSPTKKHRKDPVRYLRNESWKNEIYYEQQQLSGGVAGAGRNEPFTAEVSATIRHKFADVAKHRGRNNHNQPSAEPGQN